MNSIIDLSFEKKYELKAQSPMIHFQHNQQGATLRATEVKPKLDAFLKKKKESIPKDWFIGKSGALNYKLHFESTGCQQKIKLGNFNGPYSIYYADKKTQGIFGNSTMTVVCTIKNLMELIDTYIAEFFIVHNFGRMQNKGFGSYTVTGKTVADIPKILKENYGAVKCYTFHGGDKPFERIKKLYSVMKSGVNHNGYQKSLLFLYMHELSIGNEKAWLKQNRYVPTEVGKNWKKRSGNGNHPAHYVRALLGIGDHLDFINDLADRKDKTKISIRSKEKELKRLASPIFFKVIGSRVYYVARRINDDIYGAEFKFIKNRETLGTLSVPEKDVLGADFIDRFLEYCMTEYNNMAELNPEFEVEEV